MFESLKAFFGGSDKPKHAESESKVTGPNFDTKEDIWSRHRLEDVMSEKRLNNCFDERFRKALLRYGDGARYQPPDMRVIEAFMFDVRDLYLILIAVKKNDRAFRAQAAELQREFFSDYFLLLTARGNDDLLVLADLFKRLPMSFRTRNEDPLNDIIYKLYSYDKVILMKMGESRLEDSQSFQVSLRKFNQLLEKGTTQLRNVVSLRANLSTIKKSCLTMRDKITAKFGRKNKVMKVLYIMEKIQSKYAKVMDYCRKDVNTLSMYSLPSVYKIFAVSLVNFTKDAQKFSKLNILKKYIEIIGKRQTQLKKRLKSEMYLEVKLLVQQGRSKRTEKLNMIIDLHKQIEAISKEVNGNGELQWFDDGRLLENHCEDILEYNRSLDSAAVKLLILS